MSTEVIPESHLDLLEKPALAHMATVGPSGEPQNNPVWFLWDNGQFIVSIGPTGQKARNLERNPRVAFSIVEDGKPERYLEVRGNVISWKAVDSSDPTLIALVRKYTGADSYEGMPNEHSLLMVEPVRTTTMG